MTDPYLFVAFALGLLVLLAIALAAYLRAAAQRDKALDQRDTARDRARSAWAAAGEARAMLAAAKGEIHGARRDAAIARARLATATETQHLDKVPRDDVTTEMQAFIGNEIDQVLDDIRRQGH